MVGNKATITKLPQNIYTYIYIYIYIYISLYREYVEMIDLTGCESEGDGSRSEIDELPLPAIALERLEASRLIQKNVFQTLSDMK